MEQAEPPVFQDPLEPRDLQDLLEPPEHQEQAVHPELHLFGEESGTLVLHITKTK